MLYVPFALGVAVAGRFSWPVFLLVLAATALFISRESLLVWQRARHRGREAREAGRMLLVYLLLAVLCGLPLFLVWRLYGLIRGRSAGGLLRFDRARQMNGKCGPAAGRGADFDAAIVGAGHAAHGGQAESRAAIAGGEEGAENALEVFR